MDKIKIFALILFFIFLKKASSQPNDKIDNVDGSDVQVDFYLMKTPHIYSVIDCYTNIIDSLNPDDPVKILIHGFQANKLAYRHSSQLLAKGYFCNVFPKNLISIEYHWQPKPSHTPKYIYAYFIAYSKVIALKINEFIKSMTKQVPELNNKKITLIGVGLGAQIASQVGKLQPTDDKLKAIVALDPAVPIFSLPPNLLSINKEDATYVEIIHSSNTYGLYPGYGHSDIYINFADNQPYCNSTFDIYCNHIYAVEVFAEALCMRQNYYLDKCILNDIIIKKCPQAPLHDMKYLGDSPLHIKSGIYSSRTKFEPEYVPSIMSRLVSQYYNTKSLKNNSVADNPNST